MATQFRKSLQLLSSAVAFFFMVSAQAAPIDMSIVSGSAWRSTDVATAGWTTIGFDDSAWAQARAPYPNGTTTPQDIADGPSAAQLMWHFPGTDTPTGMNGPNEAWFRYSFDLALTPDALPLIAQALIIADDDFELYVNGVLYSFAGPTALDANKRPNGQPLPLLVDFGHLLQNGANVLAIHAADGALGNPSDRLNEYVYFEGSITSIPEPGSAALLLFGMLIMTGLAGRSRLKR